MNGHGVKTAVGKIFYTSILARVRARSVWMGRREGVAGAWVEKEIGFRRENEMWWDLERRWKRQQIWEEERVARMEEEREWLARTRGEMFRYVREKEVVDLGGGMVYK
ncbi:hypothetical protein ACH5RR_038611 [Cinchona calisaya]|uniref:Uncharacterized protein n=1 Tax=Cinchona calisaya TaxID=153742 RepID=A0ABD2Y1E3_9GENT